MAGSTTARGLGWDHQKNRARLIRALTEGAPCYWCALPLSRDKARNWDGEALHADHTDPRARGGTKADRLLHGVCNKQRQIGLHDDNRPALTGTHPRDWKPPTPAPSHHHGMQPVNVTFT
ncbi:hypothetical protein M3G04_02390 [Dietzia cinnamea]|uniref:hypothetical protein n=1 Tax=Dietzia cinnamea TaxID=321318 RepID=UPI00223C3834|nr:hypothetical protein [Dietzia cinnamea]MCT2299759.1 hypothetical protein [Dietzia cinnamea]